MPITRTRRKRLSHIRHIMRATEPGHISRVGHRGRNAEKGRPGTRWMDQIKDSTRLSLAELREEVQDRDGWRKLITRVTRSHLRRNGT